MTGKYGLDRGTQDLNQTLPCVSTLLFALLLSVTPAAGQSNPQDIQPGPPIAPVFTSPARIASGPGGALLVTDFSAGTVFALDRTTLETLWMIQIDGNPLGVASLGDQVYVSNQASGNVEVYDVSKRKPRFVFNLGLVSRGGRAAGFFRKPGEIAVDEQLRRVFVLDVDDKKVKVFDARGQVLTEFSAKDGAGRTLLPSSLTADVHRKQILVSDYGDPNGFFGPNIPARILIYDYSGSYIGEINGNGVAAGTVVVELQFSRPQGLAVNAQGWLFLTDALLGQVYIFDRNQILDADSVGLIGKLPGESVTLPKLRFPLDVMVDPATGNLLVTSRAAEKIVVFEGTGGTP